MMFTSPWRQPQEDAASSLDQSMVDGFLGPRLPPSELPAGIIPGSLISAGEKAARAVWAWTPNALDLVEWGVGLKSTFFQAPTPLTPPPPLSATLTLAPAAGVQTQRQQDSRGRTGP